MLRISLFKTIRSLKLLTLRVFTQNWTKKRFMANDNMILTDYIYYFEWMYTWYNLNIYIYIIYTYLYIYMCIYIYIFFFFHINNFLHTSCIFKRKRNHIEKTHTEQKNLLRKAHAPTETHAKQITKSTPTWKPARRSTSQKFAEN